MLCKHLRLFFNFSVRVRYAPSPTGPMHIGAVRTALFNYMFAKHNNGNFIVRIQDTDIERNVKGSQQQILDTLDWLGIKPHESTRVGGPYSPYIQSQRLQIYKQIQNELLRKGLAYPCFCESAPGKKDKSKKQQGNEQIGYDGKCRKLSLQQAKNRIKSGQKYAIRIKSSLEKFKSQTFEDYIYGTVTSIPFDDYILVKKNGYPTYHFANVIDDWKMEITHVIRGVEWLSNTSKHLYLYNILGVKPPIFAHLPLIYTHDGKKLSKRDPTAPVAGLKAKGYQPQAIINYTGLMGFNPNPQTPNQQPQKKQKSQKAKQGGEKLEYYSLKQLCQKFQIKRVKTSPVKSDLKKLNYFNRYYLRKKWKQQDAEFCQQIYRGFRKKYGLKSEAKEYSQVFLKSVVGCVIQRVNCVEDLYEFNYFFKKPNYQEQITLKDIKKLFGPDSTLTRTGQFPNLALTNVNAEKLQKSKKILHNLIMIFKHIIGPEQYNENKIAQTISQFIFDHSKQLDNQDVYHLLRLAVTGMKSGVGIVETCHILGRDRIVEDLQTFGKIISGSP